jgi:hypothetical protein
MGIVMKLKLTNEDRNAIDLILDQAAAAVKKPSHGYTPAAGAEHLKAVQTVLHLLQALPVSEPPADLASRTLTYISQATGKIMETPAKTVNSHAHRPA